MKIVDDDLRMQRYFYLTGNVGKSVFSEIIIFLLCFFLAKCNPHNENFDQLS